MTHHEKKEGNEDEESDDFDDDEDDEVEDEAENEEDEDSDAPSEYKKVKNPFAKLITKPEEYLKALTEARKLKFYGDLKDYCPVTLQELNILRRGKYGAKWLDRTYYMADPRGLSLFIRDPTKYLPTRRPLKAPPPRICVTGSPGCGQEEVCRGNLNN